MPTLNEEVASSTSKPAARKPARKYPVRKRAIKKMARKVHRPYWRDSEFEIETIAFSIVTLVTFGIRMYKLVRGNRKSPKS